MHEIDLTQASGQLADLIEKAREGADVILTDNGRPVAKLIALPAEPSRQPRPFGSAKGLIEMSDDFDAPLDDFAEYM